MAKDPAFLFYFRDFLVGTSFMSLEEIGAYIKLLCFQADKGTLSEKEILQKIPKHIWDAIRSHFEPDTCGGHMGGHYFNKRLREEIGKRKNYCDSRNNNIRGANQHTKKRSHDQIMTSHMDNANADAIKDIIEDFNVRCNTKYKTSNKKTKELIELRLKEGYTVSDFKTVHRKKIEEWALDQKMRTFLRPITLYGNKFESYLNQPEKIQRLTEAQKANIESHEEWKKSLKEIGHDGQNV